MTFSRLTGSTHTPMLLLNLLRVVSHSLSVLTKNEVQVMQPGHMNTFNLFSVTRGRSPFTFFCENCPPHTVDDRSTQRGATTQRLANTALLR